MQQNTIEFYVDFFYSYFSYSNVNFKVEEKS